MVRGGVLVQNERYGIEYVPPEIFRAFVSTRTVSVPRSGLTHSLTHDPT